MNRWQIKKIHDPQKLIVEELLELRNIAEDKREDFLHPLHPNKLTPQDVSIDSAQLSLAIARIKKALESREKIVVYADYDADGITAGTIMWETLHSLGGVVFPFIPLRADEGYGFSFKGIDRMIEEHNPQLVISVDHGITAFEKIEYLKSKGIDTIVTDHHVKPETLPGCITVHTTQLCGAGVSWFLAKELLISINRTIDDELLALSAIGTIADMVPLVGANRQIAWHGLKALEKTQRIGLLALLEVIGIKNQPLSTYHVSFMIAPRINAMGRLVEALDAMRLLCSQSSIKAIQLAQKLDSVNKERQNLTEEAVNYSFSLLDEVMLQKKIIVLSHESFNQGVIGLVAGKVVEKVYRPTIVIAQGEEISKASARSITGFNIIEAIRAQKKHLLEHGGHPMAAGFSIKTENIVQFVAAIEEYAQVYIDQTFLIRQLEIDLEISVSELSIDTYFDLKELEPYGIANPRPLFISRNVLLSSISFMGKDHQHVKAQLDHNNELIGFNMVEKYGEFFQENKPIDIVYSLDLNEWRGKQKLQLVLKDVQFSQ